MDLLPAIVLGYAIGSLPIGFLVAQNARGVDLRRSGCGNVGAANVYRTIAAAALALTVARTRYVSLGSVVATVMLPVAAWLTPGLRAVDIAATVVAMLILFRHRGNIARLWSRTERALPPSREALPASHQLRRTSRRTSGT